MASRTPERGWAPLRAADQFKFSSQTQLLDGQGVSLTPLSQLPNFAVDAPTRPSSSLHVHSSQAHELEAYQVDKVDLLDEADEEGPLVALSENDTVNPIARTPLRLRCGLPQLDAYAGRVQYGGAFAPVQSAEENTVFENLAGFPVGSALEIVAPPGGGKTTWAMQMAVSERLDHVLHAMHAYVHEMGLSSSTPCSFADISETLCSALDDEVEPWCAQVVVVDTEGSISPARFAQMAQDAAANESCLMAIQQFADSAGIQCKLIALKQTAISALTRAILRGIHVVRVQSLGELVAFLGIASQSVLKVPGLPPRTSVLIIDSISYFTYPHAQPLNATREQRRARNEALQQIVYRLTTLRDSHIPEYDRLTVIVTVQMSTRRLGSSAPTDGGMEAVLVPSLTTPAPPAVRQSHDVAADWGISILGRSAWRFLLVYHGVRGERCVCGSLLTDRLLYIQSRPEAAHLVPDTNSIDVLLCRIDVRCRVCI